MNVLLLVISALNLALAFDHNLIQDISISVPV